MAGENQQGREGQREKVLKRFTSLSDLGVCESLCGKNVENHYNRVN